MIEVLIENLPYTYEEFTAMSQGDLSLPQNTVVMFLLALNVFTKNANLGRTMINSLKWKQPLSQYEEMFIFEKLKNRAYLPMAYFSGACPENGYTPQKPYLLKVIDCFKGGGKGNLKKLFLETAGAVEKREITLKKDGNLWKIWEYAAILMNIKPPQNI